jgi:predicted AlkP superfamily phosphohydrolase/phosphomutase
LVPIVVATLVALVGCARDPAPVVVVGIDGLEWDVVLPLLREGRLPALEGLMRRGSFGILTTQKPAKSPVVWTTVVTGKHPPKHGVLDFTRVEPDGTRVLYSSRDRTTKALWNILSDFGQRSAVVGWWTTFPVEAISGVMVAQLNTLEELPHRQRIKRVDVEPGARGQVHPGEIQATVFEIARDVDRELAPLLERIYPAAMPADPGPDTEIWTGCSWSVRADESVRRIALELIRRGPMPDLMLVYFGATDVVPHQFWRYHQPEAFRHPPSPERIDRLGEVVNHTYEHVDTVLGELLTALPRDANVFVISDHGMRAKHTNLDFDAEARTRPERESGGHGGGPPGILVAAGPAIRQAGVSLPLAELTRADLAEVGTVADITPTILALRGIAIGSDMDGRTLENLLQPSALDTSSLEFVPSHDSPEWLAAHVGADPERLGTDERIEQLRALGYLDSDDAP